MPERRDDDELARHLAAWNLTLEGAPFETPSSRIAFVASRNGPAVLKLFKSVSDEATSPAVLLSYGGRGAVRVYAHDEHAVLIERAVPGTPLSELVRQGEDETATRILCEVAQELSACATPPPGWSSLEDWGEAFARYRQGPRRAFLSDALVADAVQLYFEFCRTQRERVLLHGDLHHDNVLFDEKRGWLAIDPKGVVGEPAFEMACALHNPVGSDALYTDPAILSRRVDIMRERLGLERSRVLGWGHLGCVLSALWHIEDGDPDGAALHMLHMAGILSALDRRGPRP